MVKVNTEVLPNQKLLEKEPFHKMSYLINVPVFESWWVSGCRAADNHFIACFLSLQNCTFNEKELMNNLSACKNLSQVCKTCPLPGD